MSLIRRLAYRDRYVWSLIQTLTGGSSVLPPVQFLPAAQTEFIVSWNEAEFREVFSALMAGADLLYPEKAHEVVWHLLRQVEYPVPNIGFGFDSSAQLWVDDAQVIAGNALALATNTAVYRNLIGLQNPPALNSKIRWTRMLAAGNWSFAYHWHRRTNGGIIDIYATPASGGTVVVLNNFDVRGTALDNQRQTGTFTLTKTEEYIIEIEVVATSSGLNYGNTFTLLELWRTS